MTVDLNHEVDDYGADFDYRGNLRSEKWVKKLASEVVGSHRKLVARGRLPSFKQEWDTASSIGEK